MLNIVSKKKSYLQDKKQNKKQIRNITGKIINNLEVIFRLKVIKMSIKKTKMLITKYRSSEN